MTRTFEGDRDATRRGELRRNPERVQSVLIVWTNMDVGNCWKKTGMCFPHGASGETLEGIKKGLEIAEPDECHGSSVGGSEKLDRVSVQKRHEKAEAAAKNGGVEF